MEDLDSLLADLNDNTTNTKQTSGNQSSRIDLDELDDLMNDLNTENDHQDQNYGQEDFAETNYNQPEPTPTQGGADELDDLLEGLSSMTDNPPPPQKPVAQSKPQPVQQRPSQVQKQPMQPKAAPKNSMQPRPSAKQAPPPVVDTTLDDLDALVEDLGTEKRGSQAPPKQNTVMASQNDDTLDELDLLMNDLDAPASKPPMKTPAKTPTQQRPSQVSPQQNTRPSQQYNSPQQTRGSSGVGSFPTNTRNTQQPVQSRNTVATFGANNNQSPQTRPMNNNSPQFQERSTVSSFGNQGRPSQQGSPQQRPSQFQQNRPSQQTRPSQQYGGNAGSGVDDLDDLLAGMNDMNVGGNYNPNPVQPRGSNNSGFQQNQRNSNFGNQGGMNRPQPQPINYTNVNAAPPPNSQSRGICGGCNQPIYGQILQALGKMWHVEHFVCGNCRGELGTANFYEQEGKPHCENCYQQLFCPRCAACDQPIMSRVITALGKKWHPEHFVCTTCQAPFPGGTFYEREGYPYCQEHYYNSSFAAKCASCGEGIVGDCINALGQQWHTNCFVCQYCHKAFTTGQFYEMNGMPYCEMHYYSNSGAMCAACNKSITGKSVSALGKNWHPDHFVCGFCYNPIPGGNYSEKDGKAYCNECHGRLFS